MITDYFIFHYHNAENDFIRVFHNKGNSSFEINEINKIMKIKINGLIHFPSKKLIDVINTLLDNDKQLSYCKTSGFVVSKIVKLDQNQVSVSDGKSISQISYIDGDFCLNDKVVVAKAGTMISENNILEKDIFCSYKNLGIEDNDSIYIIDEDIKEGTDFFFVEEE